MKLRKSGNELNGMFVSYDTDEVSLFTGNNTMIRNDTVDDWVPEEIMISTLREEQWYKLAKAPAKKSNQPKKSKGGKSKGRKSKGGKKVQEPINEGVVYYKPHDWIYVQEKTATENADQQPTTAEKPAARTELDWDDQMMLESGYVDAHFQLWFDTDDEEEQEHAKHTPVEEERKPATENAQQQLTTSEKPAARTELDWDEEMMLESGYTDAHYQLSFDTDDEEEKPTPVEEWNEGVSHTRHNSVENWDQKEEDEPLWYNRATKTWVWK